MTRLQQLHDRYGQSPWLDNLTALTLPRRTGQASRLETARWYRDAVY